MRLCSSGIVACGHIDSTDQSQVESVIDQLYLNDSVDSNSIQVYVHLVGAFVPHDK
eukprot:Pgem_evm1s13749